MKAATLNPGDVYEVLFTTFPSFCPGGPSGCDTLELGLGNLGNVIGTPAFTAKLFDGGTVLGVQSIICCVAFEFVSNTSKYTFGPPTVVDFTSIQSGAIQGRVDVSVTSGSVIGFDPSNTSFDLLLQAQGCCSAGGDIRALVVSSAVILTPEVSTFFMLGSGLLWISLARRLVEL